MFHKKGIGKMQRDIRRHVDRDPGRSHDQSNASDWRAVWSVDGMTVYELKRRRKGWPSLTVGRSGRPWWR